MQNLQQILHFTLKKMGRAPWQWLAEHCSSGAPGRRKAVWTEMENGPHWAVGGPWQPEQGRPRCWVHACVFPPGSAQGLGFGFA